MRRAIADVDWNLRHFWYVDALSVEFMRSTVTERLKHIGYFPSAAVPNCPDMTDDATSIEWVSIGPPDETPVEALPCGSPRYHWHPHYDASSMDVDLSQFTKTLFELFCWTPSECFSHD